MDQSIQENTGSWDKAIVDARDAAKRGDPRAMLTALYQAKALDGLHRAFEQRWEGQLPPSEISDAIAKAVDGAYTKLLGGGPINNLPAWLWKATENALTDCWREDHKNRQESVLEEIRDPRGSEEMDEAALADQRRDALRDEALRRARGLLPKLGQSNVTRVMEYILAAVEIGAVDIPASEIGAALELNTDTIYVLRQRGFQRLARLAHAEGLHLDRKTLAQVGISLIGEDAEYAEDQDYE